MANYTVTTLTDETNVGATVGAPGGTGLSLREALTLANGNGSAETDTITFAALLSGGTLFLTQGRLPITTDGIEIDGDINGDDTADITIDADSGPLANDATGRAILIDGGVTSNVNTKPADILVTMP